MAVESKPLFHPEVIRQHLRMFTLPESVAASLPKLQEWAALISSGRADKLKESELLSEFFTDIFCNLLGYTTPVSGGNQYTYSQQTHVVVDDHWKLGLMSAALNGVSTTSPENARFSPYTTLRFRKSERWSK